MTDHTELRDRIRRAVYERLAHGPSAPDVLDPIADAAMSVIAPVLERAEAEAQRLADDAAASAQHHTELRRALIAARIEITQLRDLRAQLERLRAAATEVRRHWLDQWPSGRLAVRDVSPPLHDAIDTLAARSQAAADRTCTRPLVDRVQVFYDNDQTSEVIEAPRAQTPTEETR